ncbi:MAG: hypothetical protein WC371_02105, partial [Parachlamydiales bacterium]
MRKIVFFSFFLIFLTGCASKKTVYLNLIKNEKAQVSEYVKQKEELNRPLLSGFLSIEDALKLALKYNKQLLAALQEKSIAQSK